MNKEDNVYTNDGSYIGVRPEEQEIAETLEKDQVMKEFPKIQAVIDSLNASIAFYRSIDSISGEVLTNPDEFMHVVAGNKLAATVLESEVAKLQSLIDTHTS